MNPESCPVCGAPSAHVCPGCGLIRARWAEASAIGRGALVRDAAILASLRTLPGSSALGASIIAGEEAYARKVVARQAFSAAVGEFFTWFSTLRPTERGAFASVVDRLNGLTPRFATPLASSDDPKQAVDELGAVFGDAARQGWVPKSDAGRWALSFAPSAPVPVIGRGGPPVAPLVSPPADASTLEERLVQTILSVVPEAMQAQAAVMDEKIAALERRIFERLAAGSP